MKLSTTVLLAGASLMVLNSCANESPWGELTSTGTGTINLELHSTTELSSEMPNVRSVSTDVLAPSPEHFQIRMTSEDGSYVKSWTSVKEFEKETEFRAGTYDIEGFYGSPASQGIVKSEEEFHHHAYFYGKAEKVKVEPGKETNVQIQATLGNAVVVVEYTDAFKNYFTDWSTELVTKGEASLNLGREEGMAYVVPGDVDILVTAVQQNGKKVTINPAVFEAEARHLYKITYNIYNGEIGHAETLQVIFNDKADDDHIIEIELSDELLSGDGPVITTEGFTNGGTIENVAGSALDGVAKFNIDASDGFTEIWLTIKSDTYKADFLENGMIELCSADNAQQQALEEAGIRILGVYHNPERMAMVDFTEFCRYLQEGDHEISLIVKDRARVGTASVSVKALPISVNAKAFKKAVLGRKYADILISYNGTDPTGIGANPFNFEAQNEYGYHPVDVLSISKAAQSRTVESKDYIYRISLPETSLDECNVKVHINNSITSIDETNVEITFPDYDMDYDPMARRVMMRLGKVNDSEINTEEVRDWFTKRLRVFTNGSENTSIKKDQSANVITASGLPGGSTFTVKTSLAAKVDTDSFSSEETLNYESEAQIPNGDFSATQLTSTYNKINVGGEYTVAVTSFITRDYQNFSSIQRFEALNWGSLNAKTCYFGSVNVNTWYTVPSSFVEKQVYTIRTVGYSHDGKKINTSGGNMNTNYYCENRPEKDDLIISAGEIFLGSYEFTGINEKKEEGLSFTTRPTCLIFDYCYMPFHNENAYVEIIMKGSNGVILSQSNAELNGTTDEYDFNESKLGIPSQNKTLELPDYPFKSKVEQIEVKFKSSSALQPDIYIPSGKELAEGVTVILGDNNRTSEANEYHAYSKGSVLKITNLKLGYE